MGPMLKGKREDVKRVLDEVRKLVTESAYSQRYEHFL